MEERFLTYFFLFCALFLVLRICIFITSLRFPSLEMNFLGFLEIFNISLH
jgi:hypothetical protein